MHNLGRPDCCTRIPQSRDEVLVLKRIKNGAPVNAIENKIRMTLAIVEMR
jgi:hypothetical protein